MARAKLAGFFAFVCSLSMFAAPATAEDISGTLSTTKLLVEDSRLVGNVTCTMITTPCLQFGAPNIALRLNGFAVTGTANPDDTATCNPNSGPTFSDGISNGTVAGTSQPGVQIIGPGMVQKFRRHGIFILGVPGVSTHVTVKHVTSHHNCYSGILVASMSDSVIDGIVSVRNAVNSGGAACGGNCITGNSINNHILNSVFGGNGSPCAAALCSAPPTVASNNDFGLGVLATSSGNIIEHNTITGNSNGILIMATATNNKLLENIVVGNPPAQVSRLYGPVGFDIKDEATADGGRNTFDRNWCITYFGPGPSPCPSFPAVVPPTIASATATPDVLWPANRKMVSVTIDVTVADDSDATPVCEITKVTSNEPIDSSDWTLTGPLELELRADRNGLGPGRTYSVEVTCKNASKLSASTLVTVVVPHDQR